MPPSKEILRTFPDKQLNAILYLAMVLESDGPLDYDTNDIFNGLSIIELYSLIEDLFECQTVDEAYTVMARKTADGSGNYYDRLFGPQHQIAYKGFATVLAKNERRRVKVAVDMAAGTGVNTLTLTQHAERVIAIRPLKVV